MAQRLNNYGGLPDPFLNNNALAEAVYNATSARADWLKKFGDPRRDIEAECGYESNNTIIGPEVYKQLYDRDAIANRVVQVLPKESWQNQPTIFEDDNTSVSTPFEEAWDGLEVSLLSGGISWHQDESGSTIWEHLLRADILAGIGHFGVLLLGIDDGRNLQDPVDGVMVVNDSPVSHTDLKRFEAMSIPQEDVKLICNARLCGKNDPPESERLHRSWSKTLKESFARNAKQQGKRNQQTTGKSIPTSGKPDTPNIREQENYGTDAQYQPGLGMGMAMPAAASLSGTDQQYFGVTFGPSESFGKPAKKAHRLLFLRAFDESLVQVVRYEWNVKNPRFGMPVMYRITLNDPREVHSGVGLPLATVYVHWSRVIHIADNLGSSEIFGVPRMRPVLNRLYDLRKLYGGSAEGYWKSCFMGLSFETHPQLGGDVIVDESNLRDTVENYQNSLQRFLVGVGGSWKTLAPSVVDPTGQITSQMEAICIQLGIPVRVFKGSERGELASSQDDASWNDRLRSRQQYFINPRVIIPFVDRLIMLGVLPEPEGYSISWPDLDSQTDRDKAGVALTKTQAITAYVGGGGEQLVAPEDFLTRVLSFTEEEAEEILDAADKKAKEEQEEQQALADQHGMIPSPPEGFQHPPQPETPAPIKVKDGETLIHPQTGKPIAEAPQAPEAKPAQNVFCPTGPGGGIDPTCSPGGTPKAEPKLPDPDKVTVLKGLAGMNAPKLVVDEKGEQWVMKGGYGKSPQLANEHQADQIYAAIGVPVPQTGLVETSQGLVKFSKCLGDDCPNGSEALRDWMKGKSPEEQQAMFSKIGQNFAADALLANWDVIGADPDPNIGFGNVHIMNGVPYRVDNGGALQYSGMGSVKSFGEKVGELDTMRNAAINPSAAKIFGHLTDSEVAKQALDLYQKKDAILNSITDANVKYTMEKRLESMKQWAESKQAKVEAPKHEEPKPVESPLQVAQPTSGYPHKVDTIVGTMFASESGHSIEIHDFNSNTSIGKQLKDLHESFTAPYAIIVKAAVNDEISKPNLAFDKPTFFGKHGPANAQIVDQMKKDFDESPETFHIKYKDYNHASPKVMDYKTNLEKTSKAYDVWKAVNYMKAQSISMDKDQLPDGALLKQDAVVAIYKGTGPKISILGSQDLGAPATPVATPAPTPIPKKSDTVEKSAVIVKSPAAPAQTPEVSDPLHTGHGLSAHFEANKGPFKLTPTYLHKIQVLNPDGIKHGSIIVPNEHYNTKKGNKLEHLAKSLPAGIKIKTACTSVKKAKELEAAITAHSGASGSVSKITSSAGSKDWDTAVAKMHSEQHLPTASGQKGNDINEDLTNPSGYHPVSQHLEDHVASNFPKLSAKEKTWIADYTNHYHEFNKESRKCPPDFECLKDVPGHGHYYEKIQSIISGLKNVGPFAQPVRTYRGVRSIKDMESFLQPYKEAMEGGHLIQMPSVTSASVSQSFAKGWADASSQPHTKAVMHYIARTGLFVSSTKTNVGPHYGEYEIVQSPRATYKVHKIHKDANGLHHIYMEEVL